MWWKRCPASGVCAVHLSLLSCLRFSTLSFRFVADRVTTFGLPGRLLAVLSLGFCAVSLMRPISLVATMLVFSQTSLLCEKRKSVLTRRQ